MSKYCCSRLRLGLVYIILYLTNYSTVASYGLGPKVYSAFNHSFLFILCWRQHTSVQGKAAIQANKFREETIAGVSRGQTIDLGGYRLIVLLPPVCLRLGLGSGDAISSPWGCGMQERGDKMRQSGTRKCFEISCNIADVITTTAYGFVLRT